MQRSKGKRPRKKAPREDDVTVAVAGPSRARHVSFPFEVLILLRSSLYRSQTNSIRRSRITMTHIDFTKQQTTKQQMKKPIAGHP
jgi:hypothetical protein